MILLVAGIYYPERYDLVGGSLKRVPHQLGVSLISIGAGRAWGWLAATTNNHHTYIVLQTISLAVNEVAGR